MHAQSSHGRGAVSNGGVGGVGRVGGGEGGGFNSNFRQLRPNSGIDCTCWGGGMMVADTVQIYTCSS